MSDETASNARTSPLAVIGLVVAALAIALVAWAVWTADPAIERSVIGTAGLAVALDDLEVVERPQREENARDGVGLRILPLYDNDARTDEDDFAQSRDLRQELRRTNRSLLRSKVEQVPTLIVLPKWRLGALSQAVFHPTMLLGAGQMRPPLEANGARVNRAKPVFETFEPSGRFNGPITLYAAQTLRLRPDGACTPVVWRGADRFGAALLARCGEGRGAFHLLSDPDIVNNHGLGIGGNLDFTRTMIADLRGNGRAVLDHYSGLIYPRAARGDDRERSLADLARLFEGPLILVWLGLGFLAALALWRGGVRFGAVDRGTPNFHEASRGAMIAADARILRASGADAPLLMRHAEDRLAATARALFGRSASPDTFFAALTRRAPEKADALRDALEDATQGITPPAWLARFDAALGAAQEEFRR